MLLRDILTPSFKRMREELGLDARRTEGSVVELYPQYVWMATGYAANFSAERLKPLQGRRVVLIPPIDDTLSAYTWWMEEGRVAEKRYHLQSLSVSLTPRICIT